jgi:poly-gamma-glutamate synthesis protein (capsule biosynthesis protein)
VLLLLAACDRVPSPTALPAPPSADPIPDGATIHVLALGDVTFGRYVGAGVSGGDFGAPLAGLAPDLQAADLGIANLEGVLQPDPPPFQSSAAIRDDRLIGDIRAVPALAQAGLTVLGLANNHALDGGAEDLLTTSRALAAGGITAAGAGADAASAGAPQIRLVHGLRVALLARSAVPLNPLPPGTPAGPAGPALLDPDQPADLQALAADLQAARADADIVILLLHWGTEYSSAVTDAQRRVAAVAAAAGVDLVVGAHPHVAEPVELLGARPTLVAWSLGNAVFDQQWTAAVREGLALDVRFDRAGLLSAVVRPLWRDGVTPRLVPADDPHGADVLSRIRPASPPALQAWELTGATQNLYTLTPALAWRRAGAPRAPLPADLDGDGARESVALAGGRLAVQQAEAASGAALLWQTPPDWRVDSVAVAEADSRPGPEFAFTVWKATAPTEIRATAQRDRVLQHVFLFGWRRGAIRPVWNSSALSAPFRAFTFAPGPAGGPAPLVGLESSYTAPDGPVAVVVWNWNGFGYTLEWRSAQHYAAQTIWREGPMILVH